MPEKLVLVNAVSIVLQYSLLVFIYLFLYFAIKYMYTDLTGKAFFTNDRKARLILLDSGGLQFPRSEFYLKETFTIGRNEHSNIVIKDTVVSHDHACIAGQKNDYWLADLNSTNGTFLNDRPVKGEILLKDGDIVKIGTVSFKFER